MPTVSQEPEERHGQRRSRPAGVLGSLWHVVPGLLAAGLVWWVDQRHKKQAAELRQLLQQAQQAPPPPQQQQRVEHQQEAATPGSSIHLAPTPQAAAAAAAAAASSMPAPIAQAAATTSSSQPVAAAVGNAPAAAPAAEQSPPPPPTLQTPPPQQAAAQLAPLVVPPLPSADAIAAEVARLQGVYGSMAAGFAAKGLDTAFIADMAAWFQGANAGAPGLPWPVTYPAAPVPTPLGPHPARLLVLPVNEAGPALGAAAVAASREVLALLPPGTKVFSNPRAAYHVTVFHTSHPHDPRVDATQQQQALPGTNSGSTAVAAAGTTSDASSAKPQQGSGTGAVHIVATSGSAATTPPAAAAGGGNGSVSSSSSSSRAGEGVDWDAVLGREQEAMRRLVAALPAPQLEVCRVVLASSGTLLLTWTDPTGAVAALRQGLHAAFPGATHKQSTIIHTSLLRVLTPDQLTPDTTASIAAACERWTQRLAGRRLVVPAAWWVSEAEFSTIQGERVPLRFGC